MWQDLWDLMRSTKRSNKTAQLLMVSFQRRGPRATPSLASCVLHCHRDPLVELQPHYNGNNSDDNNNNCIFVAEQFSQSPQGAPQFTWLLGAMLSPSPESHSHIGGDIVQHPRCPQGWGQEDAVGQEPLTERAQPPALLGKGCFFFSW